MYQHPMGMAEYVDRFISNSAYQAKAVDASKWCWAKPRFFFIAYRELPAALGETNVSSI